MALKILRVGWQATAPRLGLGPAAYYVLILIAILPDIYLNCYAHPSPVDDYYNSVWSSYTEALQRVYFTNNGRFFSTAITTLNPLHWHSIIGYRILTAAIMLLYAWSFPAVVLYFLRRFTDLSMGACRLIAIGTLFLVLNNLASHTEGFFWFTGAATYTLSVPLLLSLAIIASHLHERLSWSRQIAFLLVTGMVCGSNEVSLTACGILHGGLLIHYFREGATAYIRFYFLAFLFCLLCGSVVLFSPGAWARHGGYDTSLLSSAGVWLVGGLKMTLYWLSDPFLILYAALAICVMSQSKRRTAFIPFHLALLAPLAVVLVLSAIPCFGMGSMPPPRILNVVYAAFLLALIPLLWQLSFTGRRWLEGMARGQQSVTVQAAIILIIIALGYSLPAHNLRESNYFLLARNVVQNGPQVYDAGMQERYRFMKNACNDCLITVAPIPFEQGNLLSIGDVRADTGATRNVSYSRYWGKRAVRRAQIKE